MLFGSFNKHINLNLLITQGLVFFIFLQKSGLEPYGAAKLSLLYLAQVFVGLCVVLVLIPSLKKSVEAQVGMAFLVGSVALVLSSVLSDVLPWWLLLIPALFLFLNRKSHCALSEWAMSRERTFFDFCFFNVIVITFVGGFRREIYLVSLLLLIHLWLMNRYKDSDSPVRKIVNNTPFYLLYFSTAMWTSNLITASHPYGSKLLRPLFTGSDDQIFSEVMSNSLNQSGLTSNMAAIGSEIKYHWFSFAWSGAMSDFTDSPPFAVTLHAVPLFCVFATALLVVSVSNLIRPSRNTAWLSMCILFMGNSLPMFNNLPYYFAFTTSNIFSIVVFLGASILFIQLTQSWDFRILLMLVFLSVVLTLSKAPYMVIYTAGIFLSTLCFKDKNFKIMKNVILLTGILFAVFVTCYILFFQASWFNARYTFGPSFLSAEGSINLVSLLGVVLFACARLGLLQGLLVLAQDKHNNAVCYVVGISIASISGFIFDGKTSESHLIAPALTISAPLIAHVLSSFRKSLLVKRKTFISVCVLTFLFSSLVLVDFNQLLIYKNFELLQSRFIQLMHPGLSAMVAIIVCALFIRFTRVYFFRFALILGFTLSSFIGFIVHVGLQSQTTDRVDVSLEEVELFDWIRLNTTADSILATNRYLCRDEFACDHDDSSQVLSAFSRRRVYIEGPRFVSGGHPNADWVKKRIEISLNFADEPTAGNTVTLKGLNIDYFLLDERFTLTRCASLPKILRTIGPLCLIEI